VNPKVQIQLEELDRGRRRYLRNAKPPLRGLFVIHHQFLYACRGLGNIPLDQGGQRVETTGIYVCHGVQNLFTRTSQGCSEIIRYGRCRVHILEFSAISSKSFFFAFFLAFFLRCRSRSRCLAALISSFERPGFTSLSS